MNKMMNVQVVDNWNMLARRFADLFTVMWTKVITPYMQLRLLLLQYFLKTSRPIVLWAYYDIEGWHKINKATTKRITSEFDGRPVRSSFSLLQEYHQRHPNRNYLTKIGRQNVLMRWNIIEHLRTESKMAIEIENTTKDYFDK